LKNPVANLSVNNSTNSYCAHNLMVGVWPPEIYIVCRSNFSWIKLQILLKLCMKFYFSPKLLSVLSKQFVSP